MHDPVERKCGIAEEAWRDDNRRYLHRTCSLRAGEFGSTRLEYTTWETTDHDAAQKPFVVEYSNNKRGEKTRTTQLQTRDRCEHCSVKRSSWGGYKRYSLERKHIKIQITPRQHGRGIQILKLSVKKTYGCGNGYGYKHTCDSGDSCTRTVLYTQAIVRDAL